MSRITYNCPATSAPACMRVSLQSAASHQHQSAHGGCACGTNASRSCTSSPERNDPSRPLTIPTPRDQAGGEHYPLHYPLANTNPHKTRQLNTCEGAPERQSPHSESTEQMSVIQLIIDWSPVQVRQGPP